MPIYYRSHGAVRSWADVITDLVFLSLPLRLLRQSDEEQEALKKYGGPEGQKVRREKVTEASRTQPDKNNSFKESTGTRWFNVDICSVSSPLNCIIQSYVGIK